MKWVVTYKNTKQIEKAVLKMRENVRRAFAQAVFDLQTEGPRPHGWNVKELKGSYKGLMRLRLDFRHRMIYSVFEKVLTIEIVEVTTRENAYK